MNKIVAIGLVALWLVVAVVPATAAQEETFDFYIEKMCADPNVNWCVLQNGVGLLTVLNGGKVYYTGPNPGRFNAHEFLQVSSKVYLENAAGMRLLEGHFTFVGDHGYFTLKGVGNWALLRTQGLIGVVDWDTSTFSLDGTYRLAGR